jgi:PPOX class probable F420-dependent enzyme
VTTLDDLAELAAREQYLAVVSTVRADHTIQSSVVNAGLMPHPLTSERVLAFVTYGRTKLVNLRARPQFALTVRSGWQWATAEGTAEVLGPDDPNPAMGPEDLRLLLRQVFTSAGGTHDDWAAYDREMLAQRRAAVLLAPRRVYSN